MDVRQIALLRQMGDVFDRGDDDLRIEEWIYSLARDAERAKGGLYSVMGNHEVRQTGLGASWVPHVGSAILKVQLVL